MLRQWDRECCWWGVRWKGWNTATDEEGGCVLARHEDSSVGTYYMNFRALLIEASPFIDLFPEEKLLLPVFS